MIDQLVASRGKIFFGCWFSTFTGYINRIRGYHSVKDKLPGYKSGVLPTTYYYATIEKKFEMHKVRVLNSVQIMLIHGGNACRIIYMCILINCNLFCCHSFCNRDRFLCPHDFFFLSSPKYSSLRPGFFNREYPSSWRDIDKGIVELAESSTKES